MAERMQSYRCDKCGQISMVLNPGGGSLLCCKEPMRLLAENTVDAAREKHVPVIERTAGNVTVKVGSIAHPMEEKHYIQWIELIVDSRIYCRFLKPGDRPEAEFAVATEPGQLLAAREYCNLHGYWKGESL